MPQCNFFLKKKIYRDNSMLNDEWNALMSYFNNLNLKMLTEKKIGFEMFLQIQNISRRRVYSYEIDA